MPFFRDECILGQLCMKSLRGLLYTTLVSRHAQPLLDIFTSNRYKHKLPIRWTIELSRDSQLPPPAPPFSSLLYPTRFIHPSAPCTSLCVVVSQSCNPNLEEVLGLIQKSTPIVRRSRSVVVKIDRNRLNWSDRSGVLPRVVSPLQRDV